MCCASVQVRASGGPPGLMANLRPEEWGARDWGVGMVGGVCPQKPERSSVGWKAVLVGILVS